MSYDRRRVLTIRQFPGLADDSLGEVGPVLEFHLFRNWVGGPLLPVMSEQEPEGDSDGRKA